MIDERKLRKVLDRIATALEALAHIEAPAKPAAPTRSEAELRARKSVSVIHRDRCARPSRTPVRGSVLTTRADLNCFDFLCFPIVGLPNRWVTDCS